MKYELEELEQRIHTPQLEGIGERLEDDVCEMLQRAGIYFRIFHRVKTPESIVDKINKDGYGFEDDEKRMQDLIGMRIVVYYYDDMKILQTVFDRTFARQGEWAVTDNSSEEFKASKLNGVYRIPDEYRSIYNGDLSMYPIDSTFEVQLRTISFEGWHEIEHDMRYKSPYGGEFWRNNEDLSRTLNCVLANLELCDWTTLNVFEKLARYHYEEGNWEMMIKGRFRLRFAGKPLSQELVDFFNENHEVIRCMYHCSRADVLYALLNDVNHEDITFDLLVKVMNESVADYDLKLKKKLSKICKDLVKSEKTVKTERLELKPLEISPSFELSVTLLHKEEDDIYQEFMAAVQIIGVWAQGRFRNVTDDIPLTPDDYEFHSPGYNLSILGNRSLGFYKLCLDYVDTTRPGMVWRTKVSLERSDRIRMRVDCDYCHPPERFVRESFAKPRFVDEIFRRIGYEDVIPMSLKPQRVDSMEKLEQLSQFTANHNRTLPVILAVEEEEPEHPINIGRLAETVGTYAHVFVLDKEALPMLVEASDYSLEELSGAVWVTFQGGEDRFFTKKMIENCRFDINRLAFESGNISEKAFRHKLVRLIKEHNAR